MAVYPMFFSLYLLKCKPCPSSLFSLLFTPLFFVSTRSLVFSGLVFPATPPEHKREGFTAAELNFTNLPKGGKTSLEKVKREFLGIIFIFLKVKKKKALRLSMKILN